MAFSIFFSTLLSSFVLWCLPCVLLAEAFFGLAFNLFCTALACPEDITSGYESQVVLFASSTYPLLTKAALEGLCPQFDGTPWLTAFSTIISLITHLLLLAFVYLCIAVTLCRGAILEGVVGNHSFRWIFSTKVTLDHVLYVIQLTHSVIPVHKVF